MKLLWKGAALLAVLMGLANAAGGAEAKTPRPFASDRISVTVTGSGPDVVLIPGLGSTPRIWKSTIAGVPGYRYHLVQAKGFAGTKPEANAQGPVAAPVAAEIGRYVSAAGLKAPAVVGHSMGGTIGLMLAAREPAKVGKLMVVDMPPFASAMVGGPSTTAETMRPIAENIRRAMSAAPTPQGEAMLAMTIDGMVRTAAERPAILADSRASDRGAVANAYYEILTTDLRPELPRVTAPMTVLYVTPAGAPLNDAGVDAFYRASYAGARRATLKRVPDAAHFIMLDQPARFRAELKAFLVAK